LGRLFPLLHVLLPACIHLTGSDLQLTLKLSLAAAGVLVGLSLFLRQAGVEREG
jgi:hypothetical protein